MLRALLLLLTSLAMLPVVAAPLGVAGDGNVARAAGDAGVAGDAGRGRALLLQRQDTGCILCHVVPGLPQGGALGPPLNGLAQRYSSADLQRRIADARRFNPETIMPPYFSTEGLHNVARAQRGKTVLSEQALADIVAYLLAPTDDKR